MTRVFVERLLQQAGHGSSQPWVADASDGARYVVKFAGAGPGSAALLAELVVNTLAVRWGYPVPVAQPVWLPKNIPRAGTDEFWQVMDHSRGWNLGVRWLPNVQDVALAEPPPFPPALLAAMSVIDCLFVNFDRTTLSGNVMVDDDHEFWLIDHGSCRFLSRLADAQPAFDVPANHFLRDSLGEADATAPSMDEAALLDALALVPPQWLQAAGLSHKTLAAGLAHRIEAFIRARAAR